MFVHNSSTWDISSESLNICTMAIMNILNNCLHLQFRTTMTGQIWGVVAKVKLKTNITDQIWFIYFDCRWDNYPAWCIFFWNYALFVNWYSTCLWFDYAQKKKLFHFFPSRIGKWKYKNDKNTFCSSCLIINVFVHLFSYSFIFHQTFFQNLRLTMPFMDLLPDNQIS